MASARWTAANTTWRPMPPSPFAEHEVANGRNTHEAACHHARRAKPLPGQLTRGDFQVIADPKKAGRSRLILRFRETGAVEPAPHAGGLELLTSEESLLFVWVLVKARPDGAVESSPTSTPDVPGSLTSTRGERDGRPRPPSSAGRRNGRGGAPFKRGGRADGAAGGSPPPASRRRRRRT